MLFFPQSCLGEKQWGITTYTWIFLLFVQNLVPFSISPPFPFTPAPIRKFHCTKFHSTGTYKKLRKPLVYKEPSLQEGRTERAM